MSSPKRIVFFNRIYPERQNEIIAGLIMTLIALHLTESKRKDANASVYLKYSNEHEMCR